MLNEHNRIKNSKIDKIRLKSSEIDKIKWNKKNYDFNTGFMISTKETYTALQ
jgi:hypothetical protein